MPGTFGTTTFGEAKTLLTHEGPPPVQGQAHVHDRGPPVQVLRLGPEARVLVTRLDEDKLPRRSEPLRNGHLEEVLPVPAQVLTAEPL